MKIITDVNRDGVTKVTIKRICNSCHGTGVYIGISERDEAAVVCHTCKGTGEETVIIFGKRFRERISKEGVTKVFQTTAGFVISSKFEGGLPYHDWFNGKEFPERGAELRGLACPLLWYQYADSSRRPDWKQCRENMCKPIIECKFFKDKAICWEAFDKKELGEM